MTCLSPDHAARLARARLSLEGLSIGDGFGERFFHQSTMSFVLKKKELPFPPWRTTDDTAMALSVYEVLAEHGSINQQLLARRFAERYLRESDRGYSRSTAELLMRVQAGEPWHELSPRLFQGQGSMGNGSAMRVGPVGAYFADDLAALAQQAAASAVVTHAHEDAQAGAIAVALAAAYAWQQRAEADGAAAGLIDFVLERTPDGRTAAGLRTAAEIPLATSSVTAARALGNGDQVMCCDTVPFCIWSAAKSLKNFEQALWNTVSAYGDMDTTCAIVGGIVALSVGHEGIPAAWSAAREPLGL